MNACAKQFIRICGMKRVRTSPHYRPGNGKLERYHRTIKSECIQPGTPLSRDDARRLVATYVEQYNETRLHSALGYITPVHKLFGREREIVALGIMPSAIGSCKKPAGSAPAIADV